MPQPPPRHRAGGGRGFKNGTLELMQQLYTSGLPITEVDYKVDGPLANLQGPRLA